MQIIIWFGNNFSLKMEKCSCTMPLSCLKCFAKYLSIHSLKPQTVSVVIALKVSLNQKKFPILKSVSLVIGLLTFWAILGKFLEVFQKLCVWVIFKFFPGNFLESVSLGMYPPYMGYGKILCNIQLWQFQQPLWENTYKRYLLIMSEGKYTFSHYDLLHWIVQGITLSH